MATKSAKITTRERDQSFVATTTGTGLKLACIGYASKGPLMTPTKISTYKAFQNTFGKTPLLVPYSHMAIRRYFNQGSELTFVRVGVDPDSEIPDEQEYKATYATIGIDLYKTLGTKASILSAMDAGDLEDSPNSPDKELTLGETYKSFYMLNDGTIRKFEFTLDDSQVSPGNDPTYIDINDLISQLNTAATALGFTFRYESGEFYIETVEVGASASLKLIGSNSTRDLWYTLGLITTNNGTATAVGTDPTSGDLWTDVNTPLETPNLHVNVTFKEAGSDGNRYRIRFVESKSPFDIGEKVYTGYLLDGADIETAILEIYENLEWTYYKDTVVNPNFFVNKINAESAYIELAITDVEDYIAQDIDDENIFFIIQNDTSVNKYYQLTDGADGIPINDNDTPADDSDDFVDSAVNNRLFRAGIDLLRSSDVYEYDLMICPGQTSAAIIDKMIQLSSSDKRQDFMFIFDTPFGLTYSNAVKFTNGTYSDDDMYVNTSFGCVYWSWQEDYDEDNARYVYVPPSVYIVELQAMIFNQFNAWTIPAGPRRGTLNAIAAEHYPDEDEMDVMVDGEVFNCLNPITLKPQYGVVVWDEVTTLRANSSLRDIHVRHAVNRLKKDCKKSMMYFQFEENTSAKRSEAKKALESIMKKYTTAFYSTTVNILEDDLTNDIANQRMRVLIEVEPVRGIKDIQLTFNIKNYGGIE